MNIMYCNAVTEALTVALVSGPNLPTKGWGEIERERSGQLPIY